MSGLVKGNPSSLGCEIPVVVVVLHMDWFYGKGTIPNLHLPESGLQDVALAISKPYGPGLLHVSQPRAGVRVAEPQAGPALSAPVMRSSRNEGGGTGFPVQAPHKAEWLQREGKLKSE